MVRYPPILFNTIPMFSSHLTTDFGRMHPNDPNIGNTGPFWIGSGKHSSAREPE